MQRVRRQITLCEQMTGQRKRFASFAIRAQMIMHASYLVLYQGNDALKYQDESHVSNSRSSRSTEVVLRERAYPHRNVVIWLLIRACIFCFATVARVTRTRTTRQNSIIAVSSRITYMEVVSKGRRRVTSQRVVE